MFSHLPFWPDAASTTAGRVDALYIFLVLVSTVMTVLIFTTLIVFAVKFRKRKGVRPEQIEGSHLLEITWSVLPFGVFLAFFVWGAVIFFQERTPPQDATEVYTVAKQWMWKFEHSEGQREINELHVPVGRDVKVIMTSQDVIHSFYVPAFRIKQDVLPGRYTTAWFHATKPGTYHLFCAEYCGTEHSGMIGWIVVMEPRDYQAWMTTGGGNQPMTDTGAKLFSDRGCIMCHRGDNSARGPNLAGIYNKPVQLEDGRTVIADENYIRESIMEPGAKVVRGFRPIMPTLQGQISDEELNALVAYVKSIGQTQSEAQPVTATGAGTAPQ
ncbi:MAG TPA: cytochrome c oxidase subunit II [Terriglobales bacterium]|nr:cytochrome c oxidase subunit II [Terriglobales bacterium]